jgi:hypothetical protein
MWAFLPSWRGARDGLCGHSRRRPLALLGIAALTLTVVVASCATPFSIGLSGDIPSGGTTGSTTVIIQTAPDHLWVAGSYDIRDGALTIEVHAPDGSTPFARDYTAIAHGEIREELQPLLGEWSITVFSAGGEGSYDVRLEY